MRSALIIAAESPQLYLSAAEVDALLSELTFPLQSLELWVVGEGAPPTVIPQMSTPVETVRYLQVSPPAVPELILHQLVQLQAEYPQDLLLFTADELGQELCTRLAFRLQGSAALNVESCRLSGSGVEVRKRVYGNNLIATLQLPTPPYCLTPKRMAVPPAARVSPVSLNPYQPPASSPQLEWLKYYHTLPEPVVADLAGAELVLALGNGIRSREQLTRMEETAKLLGAEIGVSRPLAMNGWTELSRQIGASGQLLSPKLTIAAGVSGSAVFSCGIANSQFLVAINTDPQAAIFTYADVGIVDDLFAVLAELTDIVREHRDMAGSSQQPSAHGDKAS